VGQVRCAKNDQRTEERTNTGLAQACAIDMSVHQNQSIHWNTIGSAPALLLGTARSATGKRVAGGSGSASVRAASRILALACRFESRGVLRGVLTTLRGGTESSRPRLEVERSGVCAATTTAAMGVEPFHSPPLLPMSPVMSPLMSSSPASSSELARSITAHE
jgi:hypothetical protein